MRTPSFQVGKTLKISKNFKNMGQADFGKLEPNNIRKDSGNSQCLSVVNVINLKHDQLEINMA